MDNLKEIEKSLNHLSKVVAEQHREMVSLKSSIKESIKLIRLNKTNEAIDLLNHECRPFWMSDVWEKRLGAIQCDRK